MLKTFKYRLYLTTKQERLAIQQLEECRWVWNTLLAERKTAWDERQETISYYDQKAELPFLKSSDRPTLKTVHSQVVQDVVRRLKTAFESYFRRVKAGETPGYPRFKSRNRYDSLTYPQWDNGVRLSANTKHLVLSKIGDVTIIYHRPLEGTPKTATIRRTPTGKWFVTIACKWEPTALPKVQKDVGIDVGLTTFATLSNGQDIANPRFFCHEEQTLAIAQRKHQVALDTHKATRVEVTKQVQDAYLNLDQQGTWEAVSKHPEERAAWQQRQRRRRVVARVHERIGWRRNDFVQQHSRRIVNQFDLIAIEDLHIAKMVQNPHLAKSIHDVAWGAFLALLRIKAAWAGYVCIAVNPAYTSQDCSGCENRQADLTLADRVYHCDACGLVIGRDRNGSLNMVARGRACVASA